jgi:hypothetical protein
VPHPFLSDEWITEAREIYHRYKGQGPVPPPIRMNLTVTAVPFGSGDVHAHMDTSGGEMTMELGSLPSPDITLATDYETAKALFVLQDQAQAMQAFMSGKIRIEGDMAKLLMMQAGMSGANPVAEKVAAEVKAITA